MDRCESLHHDVADPKGIPADLSSGAPMFFTLTQRWIAHFFRSGA
jgi:hypothetical protein